MEERRKIRQRENGRKQGKWEKRWKSSIGKIGKGRKVGEKVK